MADPVTAGLAGVGIVSSLAGGVVGAQGAQLQAKAQSDSDIFQSQTELYQASVAQYNASVATSNADYAIHTGEIEAQQAGIKTRGDIGQIRASQGAGGLDVNTGSNADVRMSQLEAGEENMALLRGNAARTAYGYEVQAYSDTQQATWDTTASSYYRSAASLAQQAGDVNATASILGGLGKGATGALGAYKSGIFST